MAVPDQAARLGWPASGIEVIDQDLGLSGRTAAHRDGFKQLMGRVCLGEVGAIFGLEVSRLARSSADLARLLELARLTDTLVIDADGIYDLADINDRLLLGLKGQMSEAELHLLTSRLQESKRAAARRGELRVPLPVGCRPGRPMGWPARSPIASSRAAPTVGCGPGSFAGAAWATAACCRS